MTSYSTKCVLVAIVGIFLLEPSTRTSRPSINSEELQRLLASSEASIQQMSQLSVTWQTKRTLVKPASEVSALLKLPVAAVATIEDQETDHLSWTVREFAFQKALILDHGGRAIEETIFDGSLLLNGTATMPGPSRKSRSSWQLTRQKFADALAEDRDRLIIESNELTRAGIVIPQRLRQMSNRFELSMLDALRSGRLIAMAHSGDKLSFTIEITNERQRLAAQTDLVAYERQLRTGVGSDDNIKIELDGIRRLRDSSSTLYITYSAQLDNVLIHAQI